MTKIIDGKLIISDPFTKRFKKEFESHRYIEKQHKIIIGVSGGIDSVALLSLMHSISKHKLIVAHINHALRKDSDADMDFVRNLCDDLNITFYKTTLHPQSRKKNESIENWARQERYKYYQFLAEKTKSNWIMTGHHGNDQAETILMNLARQTGVSGLVGIARKNGNIIRPLLPFTKIDLVDFGKRIRLPYRTDITNSDTKIPRNFVRQKVLQPWEAEVSYLIKGINNSVNHFKDWKMALDYFLIDLIIPTLKVSKDKFEIPISLIMKMPKMATLRLIQLLFDDQKKLWSKHEIKMLDQFIKKTKNGKFFNLSNNWTLFYHAKILIGQKISNYSKAILDINLNKPVIFNNVKYDIILDNKNDLTISDQNIEAIDWSILKNKKLQIRIWEEGDVFQPLGMKGKQKISDFLINNKIDLLSKQKQSVLIADGEVVWVCGMRISDWIKVTELTSERALLKFSSKRI